jgi:opacity protein-like surface antigen
MPIASRLFAGLTLSLAFATPGASQSPDHQVILYGRGGGYSALASLDDPGTADTKTGFNAGGGVAVQVHRYVVLRGDFTYARDELRLGATPTSRVDTGEHLNRYYYGAAIQLQYPFRGGFTPYILAGGGAVTIDQENGPSKTKGQGTAGLGFSYTIPHTRWAIFGEGLGYLSKVSRIGGALAGFDKTQFDIAWSGGLSYAIPF